MEQEVKQEEFLVSIKEDFYSKAKKIVTLVFTFIIVYLFINDFLVYKNVFHLSTGSFLENYLYAMDLSKAPYLLILVLSTVFIFLIYYFGIKVFYEVKLSAKYNITIYFLALSLTIFLIIKISNAKLVVDIASLLFLIIIPLWLFYLWYLTWEIKKKFSKKECLYILFLLNYIFFVSFFLDWRNVRFFIANFILFNIFLFIFAYANYIIYEIFVKNLDDIKNDKIRNFLYFIILIILSLISTYNLFSWKVSLQQRDFSFNLFLNTAFIKNTKPFNLENNNSIILNAILPDCNISKITLDSCYIPFSSNEKIFFQKADDFNNTHRICVVILQLKEVQYNFFKKFNLGDKDLINKTSNYEILDIGYIEVDKDKRDFNLCKGKK
ncbi:hypothetical protein [Caminibacter pacificus]